MMPTLGALLQQASGRLPAEPPIDGWIWSYVVPAALLAVAAGSTWLLYRRFSKTEGGDSST